MIGYFFHAVSLAGFFVRGGTRTVALRSHCVAALPARLRPSGLRSGLGFRSRSPPQDA